MMICLSVANTQCRLLVARQGSLCGLFRIVACASSSSPPPVQSIWCCCCYITDDCWLLMQLSADRQGKLGSQLWSSDAAVCKQARQICLAMVDSICFMAAHCSAVADSGRACESAYWGLQKQPLGGPFHCTPPLLHGSPCGQTPPPSPQGGPWQPPWPLQTRLHHLCQDCLKLICATNCIDSNLFNQPPLTASMTIRYQSCGTLCQPFVPNSAQTS